MKNNYEYFTENNIKNWFSSDTLEDSQLLNFKKNNKFAKKYPSYSEVSNTLFLCDSIYKNFKFSEKFQDLNISSKSFAHTNQEEFKFLLNILKRDPKLMLEIGSFCGSSALFFSDYFKNNNIKTLLLCIDTWCGDVNMWLLEQFQNLMNKKDGNPLLYDHFIFSILKNNFEEIVIPLRLSSIPAARMLKVLNYKIDFIYLDSAHESGESFMEINLFYDLLEPGGVIFGDDYNLFPGLKNDIDLFSKFKNLELNFVPYNTNNNPIWYFKKP